MRTWLITIGEPLPTDGPGGRLLRAGILADMLSAKGHDVLWWTSSFDHNGKRQRSRSDVDHVLGDRYRIRQLHAIGYRRNVSVSRVLNHYLLARKFRKRSALDPPPDILLCSLPTLELCAEATRYGAKKSIPVVLDVRDLWPDLFVDIAPTWGRKAMRALLSPMFREVREVCSRAAAICGVTEEFVAWGTRYAGREPSELDKVFPMGYRLALPSSDDIERATIQWRGRGIGEGNFHICFFGTIGRQFDLDTLIRAARTLKDGERKFRFVICGSGDRLEFYRKQARDCPNIRFPGWVSQADIQYLMKISSVGLAPYINKPNFTMNLPNKPLEYLSAGLPVVSSLRGNLESLLAEHRCGITYREGDPDSLVRVLVFLHDHPDVSSEMSRNARDLFLRQFEAETVYGEMIGHLERIAKAWRAPGRTGTAAV